MIVGGAGKVQIGGNRWNPIRKDGGELNDPGDLSRNVVSLLIAPLRQCAYSDLHALAYVWYARRCVYNRREGGAGCAKMVVAAWNEKREEGKKEERKKKRNESIYI